MVLYSMHFPDTFCINSAKTSNKQTVYLENLIGNIIYHQVPHTITLQCLLSGIAWFKLDNKEFSKFRRNIRKCFSKIEIMVHNQLPYSPPTLPSFLFGFPIFA